MFIIFVFLGKYIWDIYKVSNESNIRNVVEVRIR